MFICLITGRKAENGCKNYRSISLLSMAGRVYGKTVIGRVKGISDHLAGEEHGGFRRGIGCIGQMFALKQLMKKAMEKKKKCVQH